MEFKEILDALTALIATSTVAFCIAFVRKYVTPWLEVKAAKDETDILQKVALMAVEAAEEAARSGAIIKPDKSQYAADYIRAHGFEYDDDKMAATIRAAVFIMLNGDKDDEPGIGEYDNKGDDDE